MSDYTSIVRIESHIQELKNEALAHRTLFDEHLALIQHLGKICENQMTRIELLEKSLNAAKSEIAVLNGRVNFLLKRA